MKTNAMHHLKKSFILTIGLLACALHQPAMALSLGYLNTVTNLDLSTSSLTDTVFTVCSTNSTLTNTIVIGVGQELRINGNVLFGTNIMTSTSAIVTMSGEGNFNVNTNGGTFQIGRNLSTIGLFISQLYYTDLKCHIAECGGKFYLVRGPKSITNCVYNLYCGCHYLLPSGLETMG
jgi:hypothetical protein